MLGWSDVPPGLGQKYVTMGGSFEFHTKIVQQWHFMNVCICQRGVLWDNNFSIFARKETYSGLVFLLAVPEMEGLSSVHIFYLSNIANVFTSRHEWSCRARHPNHITRFVSTDCRPRPVYTSLAFKHQKSHLFSTIVKLSSSQCLRFPDFWPTFRR